MADVERHAEMLQYLPEFEIGDFVYSTQQVTDFYDTRLVPFDTGIVCRVKYFIYMLRAWHFKDIAGRTFQAGKFKRCENQKDPKPWYRHYSDAAPFDVGDEVTPISVQTRGYCQPRDNTVYLEPGSVVTVAHTAVDVLNGGFIFADDDGYVYRCGDFIRMLRPPSPFSGGDHVQVKPAYENEDNGLAATGVFTVLACTHTPDKSWCSTHRVSLESHGADIYFEADMFEGVS
jgi:hypothetical protein